MDIDILHQQYQIAIERCKELQNQIEQREAQWQKMNDNHQKTVSLMKKLCLSILHNDKEENQKMLGENYSLGKINDIIIKATNLYQVYIQDQKEMIGNIIEDNKRQAQIIEGLQVQIERNMKNKIFHGKETYEEEFTDGTGSENQKKVADYAKYELNKKARDKSQKGHISIHVEDTDGIGASTQDAEDAQLIQYAADMTAAQAPLAQSVPTTQPRKVVQKSKERKSKAIIAHMVNLADYDVDEFGWEALRLVGEEGISRNSEIINSMTKTFSISTNKATIVLNSLVSMKAFAKDTISSPLHSKFIIYQLEEVGKILFKEHFKKFPILSEADKLAKKHANPTHGYGIFFAVEQMIEDGYFETVSGECRSIALSAGVTYVPDILATDKNGQEWYFEYECANHLQKDFNGKCMRMMHVSKIMNFIVPNRSAEDRLKSQIEKWIKSKGKPFFKNENIKIRLTGALRIKGVDIRDDECWHYLYEPGKHFVEPRQLA